MQGKRTRAVDSRGRAVPGLYRRDDRFIAGFQCPQTRRWRMVTLEAETLTEARRERASLLAGLREGRRRAPEGTTVSACSRITWTHATCLGGRGRMSGISSRATWAPSRRDARRT
jgi:hypothetical protein